MWIRVHVLAELLVPGPPCNKAIRRDPMTDCIGIDIGYGFTKTYRQEDRRFFPTAVALMTKEDTFADMSPVAVNGHRFLVGKDAEREGGAIDTRQSGFVASDAWLAVLGHCFRINDFISGEVVLGVPPGLYSKDYSRKIVEAIRSSDIGVNGEPYRISGNVKIIPQGAGIFFCHILDHQGDLRKNVAVIDIGHNTVDMVFFAQGKYVESATESQEIGVSLVLHSIMKAFYREHRLPIDFEAALDILRGREITYLGKAYAVDVQKEIDAYGKRIRSVIGRYLEKLPHHPDLGIIGGGGAAIRDLSSGHNLLTVSDPAMANAIGYWYYGRNAK